MPKTSAFYTSSQISVDNSFTEITLLHSSENGYTEVYKALRQGKWHILKRLTEKEQSNPRFQHLLKKEFSISFPLSHPGIVHTVGMEKVDELGVCIVEEFIDGITLSQYHESNKINSKESKRIVRELCDAVEYMHQQGIVHRDLTPQNILITRNGLHPCIIDFGLADRDDFAYLKEPAGTTGYASPEQQKTGALDNRSDIYSLGAIIKLLSSSSIRLKTIARKCLSENPEDRYANAQEIIKKLEPVNWWKWMFLPLVLVFGTMIMIWYLNYRRQEQVTRQVISQSNIQNQQSAAQLKQIDSMRQQIAKISVQKDSSTRINSNASINSDITGQQTTALQDAKKELHNIAKQLFQRMWNEHQDMADDNERRMLITMNQLYLYDYHPTISNIIVKYKLDKDKTINATKTLTDEWLFTLYDLSK